MPGAPPPAPRGLPADGEGEGRGEAGASWRYCVVRRPSRNHAKASRNGPARVQPLRKSQVFAAASHSGTDGLPR